MGHIGQHHANYLLAGAVPRAELVAVCNPSAGKLEPYSALRRYSQAEELMVSGQVDAVVICTPHFQHPALGIAALERGLHVMMEKPIAAHKADAERLIAAGERKRSQVFAAMFQMRVEPRYQKIRRLLQAGELGEIIRVNWIATDWFRTEAYYRSGSWRATWKGEGGGVLINQCLHNLDTLTWLLGMPSQVRGFCRLGRFHDIEVEDEVSAWLEFPGGASGMLSTSTGESPGTNRLEIAGTLGRLVLEDGRLVIIRNTADSREFSRGVATGFGRPGTMREEMPVEGAANSHAQVMKNFVDAILDGTPLIAPGAEGMHSLELANAILFSSLTDSTVTLPLDGAAYEARLSRLIAESKREKKAEETNLSAGDFASSFR
jgi:predicted dehydrogenase